MRKIDRTIEHLSKTKTKHGNGDFNYSNSNTFQRLETLEAFRNELGTFGDVELLTLTTKWDLQFDQLEKRYNNFVRVLSQSIFKKAFRRYGKQVRRLATIEGNENVRLHIHGVMKRPSHLSESEFRWQVRSCWRYGTVKFQHAENYYTTDPSDWVHYFLKPGSKDLINRSFADHVLA